MKVNRLSFIRCYAWYINVIGSLFPYSWFGINFPSTSNELEELLSDQMKELMDNPMYHQLKNPLSFNYPIIQ